jgi:hypothetical protein
MKKTESKTTALALVSAPEWRVSGDELKQQQERAIMQFRAMSQMDTQMAAGAVFTGMSLMRVKASLPRGGFDKWKKQKLATANFWTPATAKLNAHLYMSLALEFLAGAKITKPELLALPGDQLALDFGDNHENADFLRKLKRFVGKSSLNELLIKHGIKKGNTKKTRDDPTDVTPAKSAHDLCMEILETLTLARKDACDQTVWMQMSRAQHDDIKAAFEEASAQIDRLHAKTHGRAARANSSTSPRVARQSQ